MSATLARTDPALARARRQLPWAPRRATSSATARTAGRSRWPGPTASQSGRGAIDLATGAIDILGEGLRDPTSLDLVGGEAWVAEGQLRHLFDMTAPELPFQVLQIQI